MKDRELTAELGASIEATDEQKRRAGLTVMDQEIRGLATREGAVTYLAMLGLLPGTPEW